MMLSLYCMIKGDQGLSLWYDKMDKKDKGDQGFPMHH